MINELQKSNTMLQMEIVQLVRNLKLILESKKLK